MPRLLLFLLILGLGSAALAERQAIGIFGQWGAFQENDGSRCFAIAEPLRKSSGIQSRPFASVSYWPGRNARGQVQFRLGRMKRPQSLLLLRIDDRTFQLAGGGVNAWAPDARADSDIVAAIRSGITMTIETRAANGAIIRDSYQLQGAATAIDAAAIACARTR